MTCPRRLAGLVLLALLGSACLRADANRIREVAGKAVDYQRQGLYQEAERATAEALSLLEEHGSSLDFDVAAGLNDLGSLAYAQGELQRAQELFERSREVYRVLVRPDDTRLATVLYNLAGVYLEQGRYAQAEPLYRSSLEIREKAFGSGHPLAAEVWNNLGFLYLHQGKYKEAESWISKALEVWEKSAGSDAYAAVALSNLALLRSRQGSFDAAESLYQRAAAMEEATFGRDHPEVASTLMNLAALDRARGKREQAMGTYRKALAIFEAKLGAQDPLAIETRQQISQLMEPGEGVGENQIVIVRTKQEAEELRRRVAAGEDFTELAARNSIDSNASSGGRFRARPSELRKEIRAELDRLRTGQVSAVFPLGGNWAIVKKIVESTPPQK
ncbi:MAG: tetratricopeptide repeat protein [Bryobacteraceae bacterium]